MRLSEIFSQVRHLNEGAKDRYRMMFQYWNLIDSTKEERGVARIWESMKSQGEQMLGFAVTNYSPLFVPWFLRWLRANNAVNCLNSLYMLQNSEQAGFMEKLSERRSALIEMMKKIVEKSQNEILSRTPGLIRENISDVSKNVLRMNEQWKHFFDNDHIPGMAQYNPGNKTPDVVSQELLMIEQEYRKNHAGLISPDDHNGDDPVMVFPDGSAWFNLNKPGCSIEAAAMGHCGNGSGQRGQTVLSYRTPVKRGKETFWEPHLTFILDTKTGQLGEMKGRGNQKPAAKYHPHIIALLKNPLIKGLVGGGYMPENNFSISDLPEVEADELMQLKPGLATPGYILKKYRADLPNMPQEALEKLQAAFGEYSYEKVKLPYFDKGSESWVIASYPSVEGALDDLFGSVSLVWKVLINPDKLNFRDYSHEGLDSKSAAEAFEHLPPKTQKIIREHVKKYYSSEWTEYEEEEGLDEPDSDIAADEYIVRFLEHIDHGVYSGLIDFAADSWVIGTEKEAHSDAMDFLKDISENRNYSVEIKPEWGGKPTTVTVDNSTMIELFDTMDMLEYDSRQDWLELRKDVDVPQYGWHGNDWEAAADYGVDRIEDALQTDLKILKPAKKAT